MTTINLNNNNNNNSRTSTPSPKKTISFFSSPSSSSFAQNTSITTQSSSNNNNYSSYSSSSFVTPSSPSHSNNNNSLQIDEAQLFQLSESILENIQPLLISSFELDLLWLLSKDSFNNEEYPSPLFLSSIDLLQSKDLLYFNENNSTLEFKTNNNLLNNIQTNSEKWKIYYFYWANSLIKLNEKVYTNEINQIIEKYQLFKQHYLQFITHFLSNEIISLHLNKDELLEIAQLLGGKIGRICTIVLEPSLVLQFTKRILDLCQPLPFNETFKKSKDFITSKVTVPDVCYVGAIIEYTQSLRFMKSTLLTVLNCFYNAAFLSSLLPRTLESWKLHTESLYYIASTQHEQFDRPTGSETNIFQTAISENIEHLYKEVINKCENSPRGLIPDPESIILLSRAQTSLAILYTSFERFEEANLLFSKSLTNKKLIVSDTHPFAAETYYYQACLYRDQGQYDLAREKYDLALNSFHVAYLSSSYWIGRCYVGIGILDDDKGDEEISLINYAKGIEIYQQYIHKYYLPAADVYMNIGALLTSKQRYTDSMEAYQSAYTIYYAYFHSHLNHPDLLAAKKGILDLRNKISNNENQKDDEEILFETLKSDIIFENVTIPNNYFHRHVHIDFPNAISFLCVQGLLMESHEFYNDAELAYRDALDLCKKVEILEIETQIKEEEQETQKLLKREELLKLNQVKQIENEKDLIEPIEFNNNINILTETNDDHTNNYKDDKNDKNDNLGNEIDENNQENEDQNEQNQNNNENNEIIIEEKKYYITSASHYIAYIIYRLAGVLEEIKKSQEEFEGSKDSNSYQSNENNNNNNENNINNNSASSQLLSKQPISASGLAIDIKLIISLYEESLSICRLAIGEESFQVADNLVKLGQLYCFEDSIFDLTLSDNLYDEAITIYGLVWKSEYHRDILETKYLLSRTVLMQGNYQEANELCQECIDGYHILYSHLSPSILPSLSLSSPSLSLQSSNSSSKSLDQLAIHTDVANALNNYGNLLQEESNFIESEKYYKASLEMYIQIYSHDIITTSASYNSSLLSSQPKTTQLNSIENNNNNKVPISPKSSNKPNLSSPSSTTTSSISTISLQQFLPNPLIARGYNNLGSLYDDMNDFYRAKEMYEKALSVLSELYSVEGHPQIAIVATNLGSLLVSEGLVNDAKPLYEIALAIYRDKYDENHPSVKEILLLIEKTERKQNLCIIQ